GQQAAQVIGVSAYIGRQMLSGVGKQHVFHKGNGRGGAFDIGQNQFNAHQFSSRLKRSAMSLPVKLATQPSGLLNNRMATKPGFGPISNQCGVLAGTLIRSPCWHSTSYILLSTCRVNRPSPATKKRTSSSLWVCSFRNFCRNSAFCGWLASR